MATKKTKATQEADKGPICQVQACERPAYLRGLCEVHWNDPKA